MEDRSISDAAVRPLEILRFGIRAYSEVWELQRKLQRALIDGSGRDTLILCQHNPVITRGKSSKQESLLVSAEQLAAQGVELFDVERGGDMTFHGPGQLVAYPIIDLNHHRRDVGWYMRSLEEVVIRTLAEFRIAAMRVENRTGVWLNPRQKIASIGVRISRWCTMHGLALNVELPRPGFSLINPCGYTDIEMTCMRSAGFHGHTEAVELELINKFQELFRYPLAGDAAPA